MTNLCPLYFEPTQFPEQHYNIPLTFSTVHPTFIKSMSDEIYNFDKSPNEGIPFLDHLEELRRRLLKSIISVMILSAVAFYFSDQLIKFIKIPFGDEIELYNIHVTGAFYAYLKVSIVTGIFASLPIIFYQMWAFVAPGLYQREKTAILPLVFISTILFACGAVFCYVMVIPLAFDFLIGFSEGLVVNTITIGSYISFVGLLLLAFGLGFQLPILAYFLGRMGLITSQFLAKGRRYAIVGILIVGATITPPDIFTQCLLAIPMYILYEVSIIVVRLTGRQEKNRKTEKELTG